MKIRRKIDELESGDGDDYISSASSIENDDRNDDHDDVFNYVRDLDNELAKDQGQPPSKKTKMDDFGSDCSGDCRVLRLIQDNRPFPVVATTSSAQPASGQENFLNFSNFQKSTVSADGDMSTFMRSMTPETSSSCDKPAGWLSPLGNLATFSCPKKRTRRVFAKTSGFDPAKPSFLVNLPDEVIIRIFGYLNKTSLSRCARTCARLYRISMDETLWRRVDLSGKCLPPGVVGQVLKRGSSILRLARASVAAPIFENQFGLTFSSFEKSKLQYLDLSIVVIEPICLELLMSCCVALKNISLENCQVTELACKKLASQNKNSLEVIHMAMVTGLTAAAIDDIISNCQNLKELNLAWTDLDEFAFDLISSKFPGSLAQLNISGYRDSLFDRHIERLVKASPHLTELDVSDCGKLESESILQIVENLSKLEVLSASRCYGIPATTFLHLRQLNSFKVLNIFRMLKPAAIEELKKLLSSIEINKFLFSSIARPTVGIKRTSIWNLRVRDFAGN